MQADFMSGRMIKLLELKDVTAGYGEKLVLNGVSLVVGEGEIVGLVGPNGSGKSTVLKTIYSILPVQSGEVIFKKQPIHNRKTSQNVEDGIAYIPQGSKVFDKLTVLENLEMGGVLLRDEKILKERIAGIHEKFPQLKEFSGTIAGKLSGGQRQLVGLCIGLIMHPSFILIDEPSIGLAPSLVQQTMELIQNTRDSFQTSVLVVEQNVRAMLTIADRVYLLKLGRITHEETRVDANTETRLREIFLT